MSRSRCRSLACCLGGALIALLGASVGLPAEIERQGGNAAGPGKAPADARRLRDLRLRIRDWAESGSASIHAGLRLRATLVPDALVYRTASAYVGLREKGVPHETAIAELARSLPRWKRYENKALLLVGLENDSFRLGKEDRRIFTLEKNLEREGISVHSVPERESGEKTRSQGRRMRCRLAGKPAGLRVARMRVKKFWTTSDDGATRRARARQSPTEYDPAAIGRKPKISKAFASLVLEEKPAELELLIAQKDVAGKAWTHSLHLELHGWKRYEGPFEKDVLDLNQGREWSELKGHRLDVTYPPSGMNVSPELAGLLGEVKRKAQKKDDG